jgi:hypothetical protein
LILVVIYFDILYLLVVGVCIGISRSNRDPTGSYIRRDCTDAWFMSAYNGTLYGNGKQPDDEAGGYEKGDRVGMLLDLGDGSLRFFKNGAQHGPGYAASSVTTRLALARRASPPRRPTPVVRVVKAV